MRVSKSESKKAVLTVKLRAAVALSSVSVNAYSRCRKLEVARVLEKQELRRGCSVGPTNDKWAKLVKRGGVGAVCRWVDKTVGAHEPGDLSDITGNCRSDVVGDGS